LLCHTALNLEEQPIKTVVPERFWQECREAFRRGYETAATQLWGGM
jgi:hypothetical protein